MGWISCNQNQTKDLASALAELQCCVPAGDVGVGVGGAAAAGRGGRAPASGGQGQGHRDLAARAAVGAGRGGRAPTRCSRWLGGRSSVARAAGRRRRPEPGGAHCVSDVFGRLEAFRSCSIYDSFAECPRCDTWQTSFLFFYFKIRLFFKWLLFFINSLPSAKLQALGKGHLLFYEFIFFISFQNYVYLICSN